MLAAQWPSLTNFVIKLYRKVSLKQNYYKNLFLDQLVEELVFFRFSKYNFVVLDELYSKKTSIKALV